MDSLIYDRLSSDVDVALNNLNSTSSLKGAYNYTDLNRVESWCEYLKNILADYGFLEELAIKTDWTIRDYPARTQIDRIRSNIDTLKDFCHALNTESIIYNNTMNYEQANILEKILHDIDQYFKEMNVRLELSYNFGTTLIHRKYIRLVVEEE